MTGLRSAENDFAQPMPALHWRGCRSLLWNHKQPSLAICGSRPASAVPPQANPGTPGRNPPNLSLW
jgi:hypothetical protein